MPRRWTLLGCWVTLALWQTVAFGEAPNRPAGSLMMIGGAAPHSNQLLWSEFARLARGKQGRIAVFPTAYPAPEEIEATLVPHLRGLGLDPFVVPASSRLKTTDYRRVVADPEWVARVRDADTVYLCGGDQRRYRQVLFDDAGRETPLVGAIRDAYRRGALIAGSSAGTAVMSRLMFVDGEVLPVMQRGARLGREIEHGFGLLPDDWFVDQHFLARGRIGRLLVALQSHRIPYGLGIDENTAFVVEQGRRGRVVGERGVLVADTTSANADAEEPRFNWRGVRLHYLSHGDAIDLESRHVTPAPEKRDEHRIDWRRADFRPTYPLKQFYGDILANLRVKETICKLVDSPHDDALGLAFDPAEAQAGAAEGFEFRFTRTDETIGWFSAESPCDPHTILRMRLDVRPVTFLGPLYR